MQIFTTRLFCIKSNKNPPCLQCVRYTSKAAATMSSHEPVILTTINTANNKFFRQLKILLIKYFHSVITIGFQALTRPIFTFYIFLYYCYGQKKRNGDFTSVLMGELRMRSMTRYEKLDFLI